MSVRELVPLRELGRWSGGSTPSRDNAGYWANGSVPWVSPKDMKSAEITTSQERITKAALGAGRLQLIPASSVLIVTRSGILVHTLPVAVTRIAVTVNQDLKALIPNPGVVAKYVSFALKAFNGEILRLCAKDGTTVSSIDTKKLLDFRIPLGDEPSQVRVVAELDTQLSRLDDAVANLSRVKANLKRYKASVLKAAVDGRLVPTEAESEGDCESLGRHLPDGWHWSTLGELGAVSGGLTKNPKRALFERRLPYLRVANVYAGELRLEDVQLIGVGHDEFVKLRLAKNDLLVVEGNGSPDQIGRVALWDGSIEPCVHQNHLIKVRLHAANPNWVLVWLLSPNGRHEIELVSSSTSGLHTLSVGKVSRLPVPVPPMPDQERIVAEVDRRLSLAREVGAEVDANLKRAERLRQSILAAAFRMPI